MVDTAQRREAPVEWPVPPVDVLGTRGGPVAWIEYILARGSLAAVARLPEPAREALIASLARAAKTVDRTHSDNARTFLDAAFGALPEAEREARVLQAWKHFLRVTIEGAGFDARVDMARIDERYELVDETDALGRRRAQTGGGAGAILVTGHLGDWEACTAILPRVGFAPLYVIAKPPRNKPLSAHLQRVREAHGARVLPRNGAMQLAPAILRGGGSLGMLLDQRARKRPVIAPFFGRPARCDRTAGVLLRRLRAPVFIGACFRTSAWRWRVVVSRCFEPEEFAHESPVGIATALNMELEKLIRAHPEQYFWLHDRFRPQVVKPAPDLDDDEDDDEADG